MLELPSSLLQEFQALDTSARCRSRIAEDPYPLKLVLPGDTCQSPLAQG